MPKLPVPGLSRATEAPLAAPLPQVLPRTEHPREAWLDIARVIATIIVVLVHMPRGTEYNYHTPIFLSARNSFFFFLSGFLALRKVVPEGQWFDFRRLRLLGIPFLVWETIPALGILCLAWPDQGVYLGLTNLPLNLPLWFLRDLLFLSLISPLLLKSREFLFFLALATYVLDNCLGPTVYLLPSIWSFYFLGLALNNVSFAALRSFVRRTAWMFISLAMILTSGLFFRQQGTRIKFSEFLGMYHGVAFSLAAAVVGVMAMMGVGVLMEEYCPRLAKKIAPLGKSSFLVYAVHFPIITVVGILVIPFKWNIPMLEWGYKSYLVTLPSALLIYGMCHLAYLGMQRYFPSLLPYVAAQNPPRKPKE